jgi:ubiquitin-protein ligase
MWLSRYADGKVCLSLLGTFSSSDASERWNPATSSVFQVLTWPEACCTL